jgi:pyruvate-ferredoxin/flavodoxin oxidoreductase
VDEDGSTKLREVPLTPADFAREETRFKKQFRRLQPDAEARAVPVHEYIDLPAGARAGKVPFVWSVDDQRHLEKLEVSNSIVHLVEERRRNWRSLQYLAGRHVERLDADHHFELEALQKRYQESVTDHESSLDSIARAMSELAAASSAPPAALATALAPFGGGGAVARPMPAGDAANAGAGDGAAAAGLMYIREEDVPKCVNCKTCYQQAPELFEMITIVDGGVAKEVGHMVPGVMSRIKATPELVAKVAKIAANCDSEIIR